MKWSVRDLVTLAVFGAIWGVLEMSLGSMLHALHVPFLGAIMGGIGLLVALTGVLFVPKKGAVLTIGIVAMLLKAFSIGGVVLNPMIGIFAESLLAEIGLAIVGWSRGRWQLVFAGALGVLWSFFHPFLTQGILAGHGILTIYHRLASKTAGILGLSPNAVLLAVAALILIHLVAGAIAGWIAWDLGGILARRLYPARA